mmetsp:Transcript_77213/g.154766  ORF Transcript_77213/g.154766 Transcript_77213/m.154766 type:complete len:271 (+) Transcript_77213:763-1575(+)
MLGRSQLLLLPLRHHLRTAMSRISTMYRLRTATTTTRSSTSSNTSSSMARRRHPRDIHLSPQQQHHCCRHHRCRHHCRRRKGHPNPKEGPRSPLPWVRWMTMRHMKTKTSTTTKTMRMTTTMTTTMLMPVEIQVAVAVEKKWRPVQLRHLRRRTHHCHRQQRRQRWRPLQRPPSKSKVLSKRIRSRNSLEGLAMEMATRRRNLIPGPPPPPPRLGRLWRKSPLRVLLWAAAWTFRIATRMVTSDSPLQRYTPKVGNLTRTRTLELPQATQ